MSDSSARHAAWLIAALLASTLIGCASRAVVVKQNEKETVLDQPYAAVRQTPFGSRPYTSTPEEVQAKFGAALASQPQRAASFTLYFIEGKDEFTDESKRVVESVFSEIAK